MIDLEQILYDRVKKVMSNWAEEGIYAVSFFVYSNECYTYGEFCNVPIFEISYSVESDCEGAGPRSEERWNYAFWRQDTTPIIDLEPSNSETKLLFDWFEEQGIGDPGEENEDEDGPVGFLALVDVVGKVARRFQEEGFLKEKFGYAIPILVHDLEYVPSVLAATAYANINGEAEDFLLSWENGFEDDADFPAAMSDKEMFKAIFGDLFQ